MSAWKKIIIIWLAIIVLLFIALAQENDESSKKTPSPSVPEIVENCIKASGGSALAEIQTETRKGTLLRGLTGKVPVETIAKAPGKWRYHQTFAWGDHVNYGFDGNIAWVQDTKSVSQMSSRQRLDLQLLLDVHAPLNIQKYFPEMVIKGSEKVGDREATIVLATSSDGIPTQLAFDHETGLLLRAGEMILEDYRDVGGVKRPFRILLGKDEGEKRLQMKMQFSEIRHDLEVDDAQFQQPGCVLPFIDGPLFKQRKQAEKAELWIKDLMDHMDAVLDQGTKLKLMQACGRSCFLRAFGVADEKKPTPEEREKYFRFLENKGYKLEREGNRITLIYSWGRGHQNPTGLIMRDGFCMCPQVESGPPGLSPSYCYCSTGYVKENFERTVGLPVKVDLLESLKTGGKDCVFKIEFLNL